MSSLILAVEIMDPINDTSWNSIMLGVPMAKIIRGFVQPYWTNYIVHNLQIQMQEMLFSATVFNVGCVNAILLKVHKGRRNSPHIPNWDLVLWKDLLEDLGHVYTCHLLTPSWIRVAVSIYQQACPRLRDLRAAQGCVLRTALRQLYCFISRIWFMLSRTEWAGYVSQQANLL